MLIQRKIGNIGSIAIDGRPVDWLDLEWYETDKRILRKHTRSGIELALKFLSLPPAFAQGDILYAGDEYIIAVDILPCEVIVIHPASSQDLASVCYEIGNKHLPLFLDEPELLTPWEEPLFRWLSAMGYSARREVRRLSGRLRTTVPAHAVFAPQILPYE